MQSPQCTTNAIARKATLHPVKAKAVLSEFSSTPRPRKKASLIDPGFGLNEKDTLQ
jgi:hypothetical protein